MTLPISVAVAAPPTTPTEPGPAPAGPEAGGAFAELLARITPGAKAGADTAQAEGPAAEAGTAHGKDDPATAAAGAQQALAVLAALVPGQPHPVQPPAGSGSAQAGSARSGAVQAGSVQAGSVQVGFGQPGAMPPGALSPGSAPAGPVLSAPVHPGPVQPGPLQPGLLESSAPVHVPVTASTGALSAGGALDSSAGKPFAQPAGVTATDGAVGADLLTELTGGAGHRPVAGPIEAHAGTPGTGVATPPLLGQPTAPVTVPAQDGGGSTGSGRPGHQPQQLPGISASTGPDPTQPVRTPVQTAPVQTVPVQTVPVQAAAMTQSGVVTPAGAGTHQSPGSRRPADDDPLALNPLTNSALSGSAALTGPSQQATPSPGQPAPAAAPAAVPQPVQQQLAPPLLRLRSAGDGSHSLTVALHPADLGPVNVHVRLVGDTMTIQLASTSESAHSALRDALPQLRQELQGAGLSQVELSLDLNAQTSQQPFGQQTSDRQAASQAEFGRDASPIANQDRPADRARSRPVTGLDRWL